MPAPAVHGSAPVTVTLNEGSVTACPVAGCADLARARLEASRRYALLTRAPQHDIDASARRVMSLLAGRPSLRATLVARLRSAAQTSGNGLRMRACDAVLHGSGLFRGLGVHSRSARLLGAAQGAQAVGRAGHLVVQVLCADDFTDRQDAALVCLADRWSIFLPRVAGPGGAYSHRRLAAARAIAEVMSALENPRVEDDLMRELMIEAAEALGQMEAGEVGLPDSLAAWRQLMLNELDAEIFVCDLLMTEYADSNCQIPSEEASAGAVTG